MSPTPQGRAPKPAAEAKSRSSLLFWLGCASVALILLLVAVGVTMMIMLRRNMTEARGGPGAQRPALRADWRATMRADAVLPPEAALLAPARTDSGNAPAMLRAVPLPQQWRISYMRLARRMAPDTSERAALAALLRDTSVDRVVAAARARRYDAVPVVLADSVNTFQLFGVRMPAFYFWSTSYRAVEMLLARGVTRERAGRIDQARGDYRAVVGLGVMMATREPSVAGSGQGLRFLSDAAASLKAVAGRDTATANAADRLAAWANRVRTDQYRTVVGLAQTRDSLLAAATDTALPFPLRAEAIHTGAIGFLTGPWSAWRGPTRATFATLRTVEKDRDPDLAQLALAYDSVLVRLDRVGGWTRLRWFIRGRR